MECRDYLKHVAITKLHAYMLYGVFIGGKSLSLQRCGTPKESLKTH